MQYFPSRKQLIASISAVAFVGVLSVVSATTSESSEMASDRQMLASNCFQCHGTDGQSGSIDQLAGDSASDLYSKLKDQQGKSSIMAVHARGFSDAQLQMIAQYFAATKKL